jgi:hypothetical protein
MKAIRILLLVLIIIGVGLLLTQNLWIPSVVNFILGQGNTASLPSLLPLLQPRALREPK